MMIGSDSNTNSSQPAETISLRTPFRVGMIVVVGLLVVSYEAVVKPALAEQSLRSNAAEQLSSAERLQREIDKLRSEKDRNIAAVGAPPHDADLAAELLELFGRFRLKLTQFESRPAVAMPPYHGVPIKASLEGSFEQLVELLHALETDGRPLWIESVALKPKEKSSETLTLQLQLIGLSQGADEKNKTK